MENYVLTDAGQKHLNSLEKLEKSCFSMPWTREQILSQFPDDRHIFLVMEHEGEAVGYVGMMYVLDEGYISNVAVSPDHRRKGLADKLISVLMDKARMLHLAFVTLEVRASNTAAIELYKKHGFINVGQRKNYYDLPREDAILMTKFLE